MAVKVPPLLHQRPKKSQIAWYKANKMPLPPHLTGEKKGKDDGYSAAQAKKDVGEINKEKAKKKAREAAIAAAAQASKKNKELVSSSERVREMGRRRRESGEGLGGGLETNRDILSYVRAGGTIKAGRLGEAAKPDASMIMTDTLKKEMITDKDKQTLGKIADLMAAAKNKDKKNAYVRQKGLDAMKAGKVDPSRGHSPTRFGREQLRKEEIEMNEGRMTDREETARLAAQKEPPFTPDKKVVRRGPGGPMSQARWLAQNALAKHMKAMKKEEVEQIDELTQGLIGRAADKAAQRSREAGNYANQQQDWGNRTQNLYRDADYGIARGTERKKGKQAARFNTVLGLSSKSRRELRRTMKDIAAANEDVDLVFEQDDTMEKKEMAQTQLHFMRCAAEEILEFIEMGGEIEEWYQNKLSKVHSDMEGLHSYIEGEKRRTGMVEEIEQIDEIGSKFGGFRTPAARRLLKNPQQTTQAQAQAVTAYDKEGKLVGRYRSMDHAKQMKPGHTYKVEEEVELDEMEMNWRMRTRQKLKSMNMKPSGQTKPVGPEDVKKIINVPPVKKKEVKQVDEEHSHLATFVPKKGSEAKDHISIPVNAEDGKKSHEAKFHKIFGKSIANDYELHRVTEKKKMSEALDPVGKEDKDVNNDREVNKTDEYLLKRREAISAAIKKKVAEKMGK